ncbi:MAG TPA: hypothetical protein VIL36_19790, partial [Acidimicrobiales bacterium]
DETAALTQAILGGPVERMTARWAYDASAGNPLYLREFLASAVASGALRRDEGLWRLVDRPSPGPALTELVALRLEGMDAAGRDLLALLGVGEPLPVDLLASLVGPEAVEAAEVQGLVVRSPAPAGDHGRGAAGTSAAAPADLSLAHPLYGEVTLALLPAGRVAELRARLAEAVHARGLAAGDAVRVATWLRAAGRPVPPPLLVDAAREAHQARDPALAAELAGEAVAAGGGQEARLTLGHALAALGRYDEAERTFTTLERSLTSPDAAADYLHARIDALVWGLGQDAGAAELVARARHWWPDAAWRRRVDGLELVLLSATGRSVAAGELADRLVADPDLDPAAVPTVAAAGAIAWLFAGQTRRAAALADRLDPDPTHGGPAERRLGGLVAWALVRLESGWAWDELEAHVARVERVAVARGDRITAGPAAALLGSLALARGFPVAAARHLREAVTHLQAVDPRNLGVVALAELAQAEAQAGRVAAARRAEVAARRRLGARPPAWHVRSKLARAEAW